MSPYNQAPTLLKKVAGTARAALGSTNSDNTDQGLYHYPYLYKFFWVFKCF
jgi:hypothetical protein